MLHDIVDKEMKEFDLIPIFLYKSSWEFNRKNKYNKILNNWKMTFQASDDKERYFLDLLNDDLNSIKPTYSKGELWLKFFGHSNLLYIRAIRAITNHAPIREYQLKFFLEEEFSCSCRQYLIKTRYHILYKCRRFNNYWNSRQNIIAHFILFLEFNNSAFTFGESIT